MRELKLVLDRISLRIDEGEHVAVLGRNGCGKSTLIKTLTRECYPLLRDDAWMTILGRRVWHIFELRSILGIVTNDLGAAFQREVSGRDAILSGFFGGVGVEPADIVTPAMLDKAERILELLEIGHLADRMMCEMSSGEARRFLIGRALVHDPRALVLDEPTNSLDLFAQHSLREAMRRLARNGIGLVLVTHHLSDIIPEIGRVVVLSEGRVVADGPKPEILTPERLTELFRVPVDVARRDGFYHAW